MISPEKVLLVAAAGVGLASVLSLTDSRPTNVGASPKDTPTPTPSSHLFLSEGAPSQRAYAQLVRETTSFQIRDIKVFGSRAFMLASLPGGPTTYEGSDWHAAYGDLNPANPANPLKLQEVGPFTDYIRTIAMSESNPNIMFAGGSTAPGSHTGIGHLTYDGWVTSQRLSLGSESVSNSYITPDNKYLIVGENEEGNGAFPIYYKFDLSSKVLTPLTKACSYSDMGVSAVVTSLKATSAETYTGYGWSPSSA